jgi:hypothetical protein
MADVFPVSIRETVDCGIPALFASFCWLKPRAVLISRSRISMGVTAQSYSP